MGESDDEALTEWSSEKEKLADRGDGRIDGDAGCGGGGTGAALEGRERMLDRWYPSGLGWASYGRDTRVTIRLPGNSTNGWKTRLQYKKT